MQTSTLPVIDWTSTGRWLSRNDNMEVANQMAAACLALERIGRLTGEAQWREAAWKKFQAIAEAQLQNGCYAEYGGPDIGYATITLSLLAGYHAMTGRDEILTSMRRCEHFLLEMVGPEGLYDWQHTTRRTQFLYPYGLAYLSSPVLDRLLAGLRRNVVINPLWMDDRYMIPMAIDYLLAARHLERDSSQGKK